jgi:hypothetical protein
VGNEVGQRRHGLHALDRQQHDIAGAPVHLARVADRGDRVRALALGGAQAQAVGADRRQMRAAGDEHDVPAGRGEPGADNAADRARSVNDHPHLDHCSRVPTSERPARRVAGRSFGWMDVGYGPVTFTDTVAGVCCTCP